MTFQFDSGTGKVRFVFMHSYQKDVDAAVADKWFKEEKAKAIAGFKGVESIRSWKALPPISMWTFDPYDRFDRMTEVLFDNLEDAKAATIENGNFWKLCGAGEIGFREFECVFLDVEPQYDLLKDIPVQQYQNINHPGRYTPGVNLDSMNMDDTYFDIYMFNYNPKFTFEEGEAWYLGHHVREGRIVKRVGHKHYKTWKPITIKTPDMCPFEPNRFWRFTELGMPEYSRKPQLIAGFLEGGKKKLASMIYTQDPRGQVIGEWRNILIDPKDEEKLF